MSEAPFKVAAAQFAPVYLDLDKSVARACELIEAAAAEGVELLVFPEAFLPGYPDWTWVVPNYSGPLLDKLWSRLVENSVSIGDAATAKLCDAARKNRICVAMGMHERNSESSQASLYNSILFIDADGTVLGRRRKLMPTGAERLIWACGDGSGLHSHQSAVGRLGGLICWENYMPLARQAMYESGVQVLVAPTWDKSPNWLGSMQHVAREGGLFVISCCSALRSNDIPDDCEFQQFYPAEREWINVGNSCIINPKGEIIAGPLEAEEGLVIAEVDLGLISKAKRLFDAAGHYARPDVFEFSVRALSKA